MCSWRAAISAAAAARHHFGWDGLPVARRRLGATQTLLPLGWAVGTGDVTGAGERRGCLWAFSGGSL